MKAVSMTGIGGIDKLTFASHLPTPHPDPSEVLVKVLYCGINHLDILIRLGKRPGPGSFPHILGSEIVGEIVKIASGDSFKKGDIVSIYPWTFCGRCEQCRSDNEQICDKGGAFGRTRPGGYAEYITVPTSNLIKLQKNMPLDLVCAATLTGTTALHLIDRAQIKPKATVLVTGATGGVGTIVIQLLRHLECRIICATSHPKKAKKLKALGVNDVVDTKNLVEEVKKLLPNGVSYVVDIVGGDTWSEAIETLAKNGTMVFCSTSEDGLGFVNIANAFNRQISLLGLYGGSLRNLKKIISLVGKGIIKPVIDDVLSLEDVRTAHTKIEKQEVFGKILIKT